MSSLYVTDLDVSLQQRKWGFTNGALKNGGENNLLITHACRQKPLLKYSFQKREAGLKKLKKELSRQLKKRQQQKIHMSTGGATILVELNVDVKQVDWEMPH